LIGAPLLRLRWGIETYRCVLKERLKIENFCIGSY